MKTAIFILIGSVLCICMGAFAEELSFVPDPDPAPYVQVDQAVSGERDAYSGTLRVYLVEPDSRLYNSAGGPAIYYDFGLLKFMEVTVLNLADGESYYNEVETIYSAITEDNIAATAVLFNSSGFQQDACPGYGPCWFTAYAVNNCAMATPGVPGIPPTQSGFTHPVFIEEGTASWCGPCRYVIPALENIWRSANYPFFYTALIDDVPAAETRFGELGLAYFPTAYTDGGVSVQLGGSSSSETILRNAIVDAGRQSVDEVDVIVALDWVNTSRVLSRVRVTAGPPGSANAAPGDPDAPVCDAMGLPEVPFEITVTGTDTDGDDVYYLVDWGEGGSPTV